MTENDTVDDDTVEEFTPGVGGQYRLADAWNFRDVGGARTSDGGRIGSGVLMRSSELSRLSDDGRTELQRLGIRIVFDLRSPSEAKRSGADLVPDGVQVQAVPFGKINGDRAPHEMGIESTDDTQRQYMLNAYASFPVLDGAKTAIAGVITAVGRGEGPVLVHCAAGKDRAGWTVATVLRVAGVVYEDIVADFMASNAAVEPLRAHMHEVWRPASGQSRINFSDALLGVDEDYYVHGLRTVDEKYGSFDNYLDAMGIDADDVVRLRRELSSTNSTTN
ncbi:tyrosine-protein phosphatase [Rhodococcus sp. NPDC057297]|uniref:tyrosine-protein phosphatase n=1 Tax=Rhodococcus sp. NPDC057297 TaxID=3346090 RepID=UPI003636A34F